MQDHFDLIPHVIEKEIIQQRVQDGYINATAMCKAAGKRWNDYFRLDATQDFLRALSVNTGITAFEQNQGLVQSRAGSPENGGGTWVHPQVAINLAQWLSGEFAVRVSQWVYDWMSGKNKSGMSNLPYHLQRYLLNNEQVPAGYFSILAELSIILIAPLERLGYLLPPEIVPDISSGRLFCKWLREVKNIDTNSLPTYFHRYPDGRLVPAKLYPEDLLADFRRHVRDFWIPTHAIDYFRSRDSAALAFLPKLITTTTPPKSSPPNRPGNGNCSSKQDKKSA